MADIAYPASGGTLRGYLATPDSPGPWPGVVVLHEMFGLTEDIRRQADRFAERGYLALAPDLYGWGNTARCLAATMRSLFQGKGRAVDDIHAAREFLTGRDDCTGRVGVIGFCMGGGFALLVSADGFAAAAPNYGHLPRDINRLRDACPVVASYGGKDRMLKGVAARLEDTLSRFDVEHDVKEYADATHGFLFKHTGKLAITEPLMVKYDPDAADDTWHRIFTFFDQHVREATV